MFLVANQSTLFAWYQILKVGSFIFLHQTVLTQHKKKHKGAGFSLVGGTGRDLISIQGGHIFERLNSLSEFSRVFSIFSLSNAREKICCGTFLFVIMPHILLTFSLSFPGFSSKIKMSPSFPWDSDNFSNSLSFPWFFRFVATLLILSPCKNFQKTIRKTIAYFLQTIVYC